MAYTCGPSSAAGAVCAFLLALAKKESMVRLDILTASGAADIEHTGGE
jgi:hypothetical protein